MAKQAETRTRQMLVAGLVAGFVLFRVATTCAAPVSYSETLSGDLADTLPASSVFSFDVGVNRIEGTSMHLWLEGADLDSFAFDIPLGAVLTDAWFAFDLTLEPGTIQAVTQLAFDHGNLYPGSPPLMFANVDLLTASPRQLNTALPFSSGTYGMLNAGLISGGSPGALTPGWLIDYRWEFTVSPAGGAVPEPTILMMLLLGSAASPLVRRNAPYSESTTTDCRGGLPSN